MQYKYNHGYRYNRLTRSGGAFYNRKVRTIKGGIYLKATVEAKPHVRKTSTASIGITFSMTADIKGSLNAGTIRIEALLTGDIKRRRRINGTASTLTRLTVTDTHKIFHAVGLLKAVATFSVELRVGYVPVYPRLWVTEYLIGMEVINQIMKMEIEQYQISIEADEYRVLMEREEYAMTASVNEYLMILEARGMAIAGSTITLKGTFPDSAGDLVQLMDVLLKIYEPGRVLVETITPTQLDIGVYSGDYTIPEGKEGQFDFEFSGKLGDRTIIGRSSFDSAWTLN